jgi:DNA repair exonuclease SbcCD ATPase subunit
MRLVSLEVQRFGCILDARLELGEGLTVLHGPNDLGKSTLAAAIRAALLLPTSASEAARFQTWGETEAPRVVLVLREPDGSHYRITKVFSHRSQAQLERSREGKRYAREQALTGREVDGELRRLLRWGIPEPGGRSGPRGLPASFLANVLLAPQGQVGEILA